MALFSKFIKKSDAETVTKPENKRVEKMLEALRVNMKRLDTLCEAKVQEAVFEQFQKELLDHVEREGQEAAPVDAVCRIFLSKDRLFAYACILPPLNGGRELVYSAVIEDFKYDGVVYGLDTDTIQKMIAKKRHLEPFCAARGTLPANGTDGKIEYLFEEREVIGLEHQKDTPIDFQEEMPLQPIRKGEVICRIFPATKGEDGADVTGTPLYGKWGVQIAVPRGENTHVSEDGTLLLANKDGVVYTKNGLFCVKHQGIILGDVTKKFGNLQYMGDLYIRGNVSGGITIIAEGNVIIEGELQDATIISGSTIRIYQGVKGNSLAVLKADGQIQCKMIDNAKVEAGGNCYAEIVVNSRVSSKKSVYITGGRGLLSGGEVRAQEELIIGKAGNVAGTLTRLVLHDALPLRKRLEENKQELEKLKNTLEKMTQKFNELKPMIKFLSEQQKSVVNRLEQQKKLYEEKEKQLQQERKDLNKNIHLARTGQILCREICPNTQIQIGDLEMTVQKPESNCRIYTYFDKILLK